MRDLDTFERRAFAGDPIADCPVVDVHGHLGSENHGFSAPDTSLETMIATMDRMGVDVLCASSYAGMYGHAKRGNGLIIDATRRYPKRLIGYMSVDAGYPNTIVPEMERCLDAGLLGVKLWHYGIPYDHPNYDRVFEFACTHSLPVLVHTWGGSTLDEIGRPIERYPGVTFILAHAGSSERDRYAQMAIAYPNAHLDICCSWCPRGVVEYFVSQGLIRKILWGSDANFLSGPQQLGRVLFARISENDKRLILGGNAYRILGIHSPC